MSFELNRHPLDVNGQALPYPDTGQRIFAAFGDVATPVQPIKSASMEGEALPVVAWADPIERPYMGHETARIDAADYLAECRRSFVTAQLSENASLGTDRDEIIIRRLVDEFCGVYGPVLTQLAGAQTPRDSLEDFLSNNLRGIAMLPRLLILRSHNPELWSTEEEDPTRTQLPDFFVLSTDEQRSIVGLVGEELLELGRIMREHDPKLLKIFRKIAARSRPLAVLSVGDLSDALANYSSLQPVEICRLFMRDPNNFTANLTRASEVPVNEEKVESLKDPIRLDTWALLDTPLSPVRNRRAILSLLHGTRANRQALNLPPHGTIRLTTQNAPISMVDFDLLIDTHLQIIGRQLYEGVANENAKGVIMPGWRDANIGAVLRGDFYGTLQNLILSRLPVTEDSLKVFREHFRPDAPSADHFADLLFSTELKSSGQKPRMTLLRTLVIVETGTPYDIIRKHKLLKSTTTSTIRGMQRAAKTVATLADLAVANNTWRG